MRRLRLARLRLWWERAFWVIPLAGVLAGFALDQAVTGFDEKLATLGDKLPALISTASAGQLLGAIGGGMITFTGFVFSFVVLLLQFGSSQYSPRTVSYFLRARSTQWILAIFLATITFTFIGLLDIGSFGRSDYTPTVTVLVSVALLFFSLSAFIVLLHSVGSRVRVDAVLAAMGRQARRQLPMRLRAPHGSEFATRPGSAPTGGTLVRSRGYGQIVAVDTRHLLGLAGRHGLRLVLLVQVGDGVTVGAPLLLVGETEAPLSRHVLAALAGCVVVDQERSLRFDPYYSLRLLADIAARALSPGVNDPTTAVRALDEIEGVLRVAAGLRLGTRTLTSGAGVVVVRAPDWADVVELALFEAMLFGSDQPQVTRRLVALLDDLLDDLPEARHDALLQLKAQLVERVRSQFADPALVSVALGGDRQGLGGAARVERGRPEADPGPTDPALVAP